MEDKYFRLLKKIMIERDSRSTGYYKTAVDYLTSSLGVL
jgi:hypothetical protein